MQIKTLHKNIYKLYAWSRTQECLDAYRQKYETVVRCWQDLRAEGVSDAKCARFTGISRATYYRYKRRLCDLAEGRVPPSKRPGKINKPRWTQADKQLVLQIRRANPTYGKEKIATILARDHAKNLSASTVGRILRHLFDKALIVKSGSAPRARRKRNFAGNHARPWSYKDYDRMEIGERVQIDHMTVTKNAIVCKHFQAWERRSKHIHAQVYSHAKSSSARRFLEELINTAPYKIKSIQVDGGSEFMAEFECICKDQNIPLIVLPPSRPKYNGGVERGNRTFKEEFYYRRDLIAVTIGAMRFELTKALEKYNTYRPHKSLGNLTPMAYIQKTISRANQESQLA